jgi:hypothetical protein
MGASPRMDLFFLATGGISGAVRRFVLLLGRADVLLADQIGRLVFLLLTCVRLESSILQVVSPCGGDGGAVYWASFFDLVEVGGASFCFPCHGRSGSVRSSSSICRQGGSATLAHAAISKAWSYASELGCGYRRLRLFLLSIGGVMGGSGGR